MEKTALLSNLSSQGFSDGCIFGKIHHTFPNTRRNTSRGLTGNTQGSTADVWLFCLSKYGTYSDHHLAVQNTGA